MPEAEPRSAEYSVRLRKLQRREWWTWGVSVFAMLMLTAAVASLSLPAILEDRKRSLHSGVLPAVAGLVCLIVLFGCYLTYEKFLINRLRMELAERQAHSSHGRIWHWLIRSPVYITGDLPSAISDRRSLVPSGKDTRLPWCFSISMISSKSTIALAIQQAIWSLKVFADRLGEAIRDIDIAARLGGDEFMLLLPECDSIHLPAVLRRLESIEVGLSGRCISVGFSVGASQYGAGKDPEAMFKEADEALYLQKLNSKGLVHRRK